MPTKGFFGYAARDPDAPYLVDGRGVRTRGEVLERVYRAANGLRALGLGKGDHVCLLVGNRSDFLELVIASGVSGTILTAVNWHLKPDEAAYVVADASVLFCDTRFAEIGLEASERAPAEPPKQITGGQMLYSSGTTGLPKGILRRPTNDDPDVALEARSDRPPAA